MKSARFSLALRAGLAYALFGGGWILVSDRLLGLWVKDPVLLNEIQTIKGWFFIAVSALFIYFFLRRELALRMEADEKYQESRDLFRLLFENSMDAILLTAPDGSIHAANPAACRLFERTEEEIRQLGRSGIVDPADPRLQQAVEERARTGRFFGELTFLRKDGSKFTGEISTNVFTTRGGAARTSMIIRDVTARQQAEDARRLAEERLRESEERYRLLLEESPAGIAVLQDERVVFANRAGAKILGGKAPGDLIGRSIDEITRPGGRAAARERIRRMLAGEPGLYPVEDVYLRLDGSEVPVEVFAAPIRYDGKPAVQVIVQDITGRKKAEEEARLSRERLAELSRRLIETQETERRAVGRELHDQIGQILTAVKITLDMALQARPVMAVEKIRQAQALTGELLEQVSRLSLELRPPMLDDLGLVPALLWHVQRYREQTGIAIDFRHSGVEGMRFAADVETTAYRIIQEALTNTARHARAARVEVDVRARGGFLELRVEDDGQGFDPALEISRQRGLSGMRERAGLLGGTFEVDSAPGRRTVIFARLPLKGGAA